MCVKIIDLYCGMGGFSLGFLSGIEGALVTGYDIDRFACGTYNLNLRRYGGRCVRVDLLLFTPRDSVDVVIGSPPCEPFSIANSRRGGAQHPLFPTFRRYFKIVSYLRPKAFVMENVKGLTCRRYRRYFMEALKLVDNYRVTYKVLDTSHYGVPQRRKRLFVIGIRRDLGVEPSLPKPTHSPRGGDAGLARWVTMWEAISDIIAYYPENLILDESTVNTKRAKRLEREGHYSTMEFPDNLGKPSRTICSHTVHGRKRETIVIPVSEHVVLPHRPGTIYKYDWGARVFDLTRPSYTIVTKHRSGQLLPKPYYRRLSVRECLRLQSFPDWWVFPDNVSISRKYKLVGEAVPPIMAYRLAIHLAKLLGLKAREPPSKDYFNLPYFSRAFEDYFRRGS